jgi:copper homeostasis protein
MTVLLEVRVAQVRDVPGAQEGGADRLLLSATAPGDQPGAEPIGRAPDLQLASAVLREAEVPVRMMLRLDDDLTTTGGEFTRLVGLAEEYLALGAEGVCFGFLDADLELDVETCTLLADALPGVPWTFHAGIDAHLDLRRAWRELPDLPGLDAVLSGGSPQGLAVGFDDLLTLAQAPEVARLLMPGPGLLAEHVPWLARAGVRQFHLGSQARPGGSHKAYVDSAHVRAYRLLLDDTIARAG